MDLNEYQKAAQKTAIYPGKGLSLVYPVLGLNGEAGEVAEKLKKIMRDWNGKITSSSAEAIAFECGDCLWYLSEIAFELGYNLEKIAEMNIRKLASRKARGKIGGSGDNR